MDYHFRCQCYSNYCNGCKLNRDAAFTAARYGLHELMNDKMEKKSRKIERRRENEEAQEKITQGKKLYNAGQYDSAFPLLMKGVETINDPEAQYFLGKMYGEGHGVAQDYAAAVEWYRKAAEQGFAPAQCNIGYMYAYGQGVAQNYATAVEWYRKAAENGDVNSQYNLGFMYEHGRGVAQDNAAAVEWYRKAAEHGCARAQYKLDKMSEF